MRSTVFGCAATAAWAAPAAAQVSEPDGTTLPQPANPAEVTEMMSRGFPAASVELSGLFSYRGETIDPVADAHLTPGTFSPQCGFTGQIVLKGGGCQNALGWYNATTPPTAPPTGEIYQLVPANLQLPPPTGLGCADSDFCPLATHMTTQAPQHSWTDVTYSAASIRTDARYKGGQIGFALMAGTGLCSQTKYSQSELGVVSTQYGKPWITALVWQSTADPSAYYIGFEDLPMIPATWKGANNGNDGDFNDFVFFVTGLDCEGGGKPCATGEMGVCGSGTTQCTNGGTGTKCVANVAAATEVCNGLDDDCDGVVDNPDAPGLCPTGEVCAQGVCRFACSQSEFPCSPPFVCDSADGVCKEHTCVGVTCGAETVCRNGQCVGGCDGVVCPVGEACELGVCVNLCANITCDTGQVCEDGACLSPCGCRACPSGKACSSDGTCVDQGCDKTACNPPATVCVAGQCQDGCSGVVCPLGQTCSGGVCSEIDAGSGVTPPVDAGVSTGAGGSRMTGTGNSDAGVTGAGGGAGSSGHESGVCTCDSADGPGAGGLALLAVGFALATVVRRPRRRYTGGAQ